jgi:hypothetical protein
MFSPFSNNSSAPWALLWLGGVASTIWVGLLMPDPLAQHQRSQTNPTVALPNKAHTQLAPLFPPMGNLVSAWTNDAQHPAKFSREWRISEPPQQRIASFLNPSPESNSQLSTLQPAERLKGSVLLGGELDLESLNEKPMVPAARIEQALRAKAADRLEAVPPQWRPTMRAMLTGPERVLPAEVVRVPAPHLSTAEDYPMIVKSDGVAETPVTPSPSSKAILEHWVERQQQMPMGKVKPVLVVLEPLATE